MPDKVEKLKNSLIQHGRENDRIYLMKLAEEDMPGLVPSLIRYAHLAGYGKIFAKIPSKYRQVFLAAGFRQEGEIPDFYQGRKDALFLGYYLDESRGHEKRSELVEDVLSAARKKTCQETPVALPAELKCRVAGPQDAKQMADLYHQVFASYPFPIHDPTYLRQTMAENVVYFGVWEGKRLLALSSAEMDETAGNAEMTDFATLPECRGRGIAQHLLQEMEAEMARRNIRSLYTIARAYSHGMNITFSKNGYLYGGTLTHNTGISGDLESMNLWYKKLAM